MSCLVAGLAPLHISNWDVIAHPIRLPLSSTIANNLPVVQNINNLAHFERLAADVQYISKAEYYFKKAILEWSQKPTQSVVSKMPRAHQSSGQNHPSWWEKKHRLKRMYSKF